MRTLLSRAWIRFDYAFVLSFFSILPYKYGRYLASFRGYLYSFLRRDWRSFSFGDKDLWERTYNAQKIISPSLKHTEYVSLVRQRYANQSIEEFEAILLKKNKVNRKSVQYIGLEKVEKYISQNKHIVFITSHFGSSLLGITFLQCLKIPILVMSSNVVEHEQVHPTITQFFHNKYKGISRYMNGGEVLDIEGNAKRFLSFLKKRGSLVIIADLPPNNPNELPVWKTFFNKERGFASGATKLAQSTNSLIIPFVCYREKDNYVMTFGDAQSDPYSFLEKEIKKNPSMWWASDTLGLLHEKEST